MGCNITNVVLDAMDEARLAAAQHRQAQYIQSRSVDDAAIVPQVTLAVEHGYVEQTVIGAKPGRPDDCSNTGACQVEHQRVVFVDPGCLEALGRVA